MVPRQVIKVLTAHRQEEGGGFIVRRPFPAPGVVAIDPFLLLDEMGPVDYAPGQAVGAPDHPHRGFETVTYVLDGEMEHHDSAGHRGRLGPGDVQWMTAGAGVVHSEMPSRRMMEQGGRMHGFQTWVNLPSRDKMMPPRYQELPAQGLPTARSMDGKAHVRVVAGEALGVQAAIQTRTPILYHDWTLQPGAKVETPVPPGYRVMAYIFGGAATVGTATVGTDTVGTDTVGTATPGTDTAGAAGPGGGPAVLDGQLALLGPGEAVRLACAPDAAGPARLLLLGGVPLNEPVARYGPFVMNTEQEIHQAVRDYQSGRMGQIAR